MENKTGMVILITVLGIVGIFVLFVMISIISGKFDFFTFESNSKKLLEKTYEITDLENINVKGTTSDIILKSTIDKEIKVEIYGRETEEATTSLENNTLTISKKERSRFCFGFCFAKSEIIVYLPEEIQSNITISTVSGDVEMDSLKNTNVKANTTSGDIKIGEVLESNIESTSGDVRLTTSSKAFIKTVSGDITINNISQKLEVETTSGDIKIDKLTLEENGNMKSISGDVTINNLQHAYVETKTTSGDVSIKENDRFAENTLYIKTTSGDIKIK